ncbi:MAG: ABC transporter permease, partial [Candidatus Bipolaricaulia bacterium]
MLKIALRNVFRNRRRSLLSLSLIALGGAILFLARAYFDETIYQLRWSSAYQYGHLQIAAAGYWEGSPEGYEHLISKSLLEKIGAILVSEEDVERFTTQLGLSGLIGTERKSTVFVSTGVEPGKEIGGFPLEEGEGLAPGDQDKALIGTGMAENLGVGVGDYLTVMGTTIDGAYNAGALQIKGIFEWWQAEVNNQFTVVPLVFAQRMLNTDAVEKVLVELKELEVTERVAERLGRKFEEEGLRVEVKRWDELSVFYRQVRGYYGAIYTFITTAIFILVFFSILEVMTMSF